MTHPDCTTKVNTTRLATWISFVFALVQATVPDHENRLRPHLIHRLYVILEVKDSTVPGEHSLHAGNGMFRVPWNTVTWSLIGLGTHDFER